MFHRRECNTCGSINLHSLKMECLHCGSGSTANIDPVACGFTAVECWTLDAIVLGLSNKEIAKKRGRAVESVKCTVHDILTTVGIPRVALAVWWSHNREDYIYNKRDLRKRREPETNQTALPE